MDVDEQKPETIQARFVSDIGEEAGPPLALPIALNVSQLDRICNAILQNVSSFRFSAFVIHNILTQFLWRIQGGARAISFLHR